MHESRHGFRGIISILEPFFKEKSKRYAFEDTSLFVKANVSNCLNTKPPRLWHRKMKGLNCSAMLFLQALRAASSSEEKSRAFEMQRLKYALEKRPVPSKRVNKQLQVDKWGIGNTYGTQAVGHHIHTVTGRVFLI
jgi:hypothetical protein